jgi:hypothetical protein
VIGHLLINIPLSLVFTACTKLEDCVAENAEMGR